MSDIFGGIFDSAASLFDEATGLGVTGDGLQSAALTGLGSLNNKAATDTKEYRSQRELGLLEQGVRPLDTSTNFRSNESPNGDALQSVSPQAIEGYWKQRLKTFAEIQSETGVKGA